MLKLIGRKLLLILIMLPLLNFLGFQYGKIAPALFPDSMQFFRQSAERLNRTFPPAETYGEYLRGGLQGDWGHAGRFPITTILGQSVGNSLWLIGSAVSIMLILGPLLGFLSISPQTGRLTRGGLFIATAGLSLPRFFLGGAILSLMIYYVLFLHVRQGTPLPISGFGLDVHLILPITVLAVGPTLRIAGVVARLLEREVQQDYIRVAYSKGLSWIGVYLRHAWPNMVSAVLVTIGNSMRLLIGGLIVVETIFLWPGLGRMFMFMMGLTINTQADLVYFLHRELMAAVAALFGLWLLTADFITAVAAYALDPRISQAEYEH
jgi:peptide/nickel transport system permease protein